MPKYYFHIRSSDGDYDDLEGSEYEDADAALLEAEAAARELSADRLKRGLPTGNALFEVQDADGAIVGIVSFPRLSE